MYHDWVVNSSNRFKNVLWIIELTDSLNCSIYSLISINSGNYCLIYIESISSVSWFVSLGIDYYCCSDDDDDTVIFSRFDTAVTSSLITLWFLSAISSFQTTLLTGSNKFNNSIARTACTYCMFFCSNVCWFLILLFLKSNEVKLPIFLF